MFLNVECWIRTQNSGALCMLWTRLYEIDPKIRIVRHKNIPLIAARPRTLE